MTLTPEREIPIPGDKIDMALEVQALLKSKHIPLDDTSIIKIAVERGLKMMLKEFSEKEI